jgi:hypothetical protein
MQRWMDSKPRNWAQLHMVILPLTCDADLIAATTFHVTIARTENGKNNPIAASGTFHFFLRFDLHLTIDVVQRKLGSVVVCQDRDQ